MARCVLLPIVFLLSTLSMPEAIASTKDICSILSDDEERPGDEDGQLVRVIDDDQIVGEPGFKRAIVEPGETNDAWLPVYENTVEGSYFRIIFALIHQRASVRDALDYFDIEFEQSKPGWDILIEEAIEPDEDVQIPQLKLTQDSFGAADPNVPTQTLQKFEQNKEVVYFASPLINSRSALRVVSSAGAPLVLARYAMRLSEAGRPLGTYDEDEDGDGKLEPCFIRAKEAETDNANRPFVAKHIDVSDAQQLALKLRKDSDIPPADYNYRPPAEMQPRVNRLTDGLVWLSVDILAVEKASTHVIGSQGCTGFFVTPHLIMTARHCFVQPDAVGSKDFDCENATRCHVRGWLRKRGGDSRDKAPDYQALEIAIVGLTSWQDDRDALDYAVLRVPELLTPATKINSEYAERVPMKLKRADDMDWKPTPFFLPQFPNGRQLVFSVDKHCGTRFEHDPEFPNDPSWITEADYSKFRHYCDTAPISSGAPVLDPYLSEVWGVHVQGWQTKKMDGEPRNGNLALKSTAVLKDLAFILGADHESITAEAKAAAKEILDFNKRNGPATGAANR